MSVRLLSRSSGFTLVELIVVVAIVGLLAAAATAGYRQVRIRSAEAAAVSSLNAINQAQFAFMQSCGKGRYAPSLVALGSAAPGTDGGFISPDLAASDPLVKSGYVFVLGGTPATEGGPACTGAVPLESYRLTADPLQPGVSGQSYFGTNTDRAIYTGTVSFGEDMPERGAPGRGAEIR